MICFSACQPSPRRNTSVPSGVDVSSDPRGRRHASPRDPIRSLVLLAVLLQRTHATIEDEHRRYGNVRPYEILGVEVRYHRTQKRTVCTDKAEVVHHLFLGFLTLMSYTKTKSKTDFKEKRKEKRNTMNKSHVVYVEVYEKVVRIAKQK